MYSVCWGGHLLGEIFEGHENQWRSLCVCLCVYVFQLGDTWRWWVSLASVSSEGMSLPAGSDGSLTDLWSGFIILIYDEPGLSLSQLERHGCLCSHICERKWGAEPPRSLSSSLYHINVSFKKLFLQSCAKICTPSFNPIFFRGEILTE